MNSWLLFMTVMLCNLWSEAQTSEGVHFKKIKITGDFISEGIATGDVNNDGKTDLMAGSFWFEAPDWKRHEITTPRIYFPDTTYSNSFLDFSMDVNQDGWIDFIRIGLPGEEIVWYENPHLSLNHWREHLISTHIGNESPALTDVDGDGRPDFLCNDPIGKKVVWFKSPVDKGDTAWTRYIISNDPDLGTDRYTHGLGYGDMNGDGRKDVIITKGWWEQPVNAREPDWKFHPADLGEDCSQIYAMDVDSDGDMDLISASAHNYGIWWHEQTKDSLGSIIFVHHLISRAFSESHGMVMTDLNGDGNPDLLTGKRYFAHNGRDSGAYEPAMLYWFEFKPGSSPTWIPHQIDDNSGVGLLPVVTDINGDGLPDIIVANKKGIFIFEQIK